MCRFKGQREKLLSSSAQARAGATVTRKCSRARAADFDAACRGIERGDACAVQQVGVSGPAHANRHGPDKNRSVATVEVIEDELLPLVEGNACIAGGDVRHCVQVALAVGAVAHVGSHPAQTGHDGHAQRGDERDVSRLRPQIARRLI